MVSAEAAAWALRLFVGREPRDRAEIEFHRNHAGIDSLRRAFAAMAGFLDSLDRTLPRPPDRAIPPFLLRRGPRDGHAPGHLRRPESGLAFFENSLATLRPGGVAVHTTEFNLQSNDDTHDDPALAIFRRRDIETMLGWLADPGHGV